MSLVFGYHALLAGVSSAATPPRNNVATVSSFETVSMHLVIWEGNTTDNVNQLRGRWQDDNGLPYDHAKDASFQTPNDGLRGGTCAKLPQRLPIP